MINRTEPFQNFLAVVIIACSMIFFFWISYSNTATNNNHIGEIKTALIGLIVLVANYYFGSSRDSQRKGEVINQLLKPQDGTTVVTTKSPDPTGTLSVQSNTDAPNATDTENKG